MVDTTSLKELNALKYLGTLITTNDRCIKKGECRIAQTHAVSHTLHSVICNIFVSTAMGKTVLMCYIESFLLYESGRWVIHKLLRKYMGVAITWFYRIVMTYHGQINTLIRIS